MKITKSIKVDLAFLALVILSACNWGRTTTVVENGNGHYQKIKYRGVIVFNQAKNGIDRISPGGYLEFEKDGRKFEAKPNGVRVNYSFNGDSEINLLSSEQKVLVAHAVYAIEKVQARK